jgi:hypothetical protein
MLDIQDFTVDKGGNPEKIKESQRRRYAPEEAVDEVIALYEDHRKSEIYMWLSQAVLGYSNNSSSAISGNPSQYQD